MSRKAIDETGKKYGRLTVIGRGPSNKQGKATWETECSCGNSKYISGSDLRSGRISSCGCKRKEYVSEKNTTHGMTRSKIYGIWKSMKQRVHNPQNQNYKWYGEKGVLLDKAWETFEGFLADMGETYFEGASIDRIDPAGNYTLANCQWLTVSENSAKRWSDRK